MKGYALNFNTLGIGNGIIDEYIQAPHYPEFATKNTYGVVAYNKTVYDYATFALNWPGGCLAQIQGCIAAASGINGGLVPLRNSSVITQTAVSNPAVDAICAEAADMCRVSHWHSTWHCEVSANPCQDNVESPYYFFSGRGVYDVSSENATRPRLKNEVDSMSRSATLTPTPHHRSTITSSTSTKPTSKTQSESPLTTPTPTTTSTGASNKPATSSTPTSSPTSRTSSPRACA